MVDHEGLNGSQMSLGLNDGLPHMPTRPDASVTDQNVSGRYSLHVPRIIHRVWVGGMVPNAFAEWGYAWKDLHPEWTLYDWGDLDALKGMNLARPDLRERAEEILPNDWKRFIADVLRLELLYEYGGVYVDMDTEPHVALDPLVVGRRVLVARSPNATSTGYHAITNCFIAAAPKHPWIKALLDGLDEAIERYRGRPLAQMIGPWHLDRTYREGIWTTVDVVDWGVVSPYFTHYWNNQLLRRGEGIR